MPHDEYGNYYDESFLSSLLTGLIILLLLAVILSLPGWIIAAVWGWTWFFRGAGIFWLGVMMVGLTVAILWAIGSDDI